MRSRPIHKDRHLSVRVYHCLGHDTPVAAAEISPTYDVFLPWHGLYLIKRGNEELVASAGQACFVEAGAEYRVQHPIGGHDTNTVVSLPVNTYRQLLAESDPTVAEVSDKQLRFHARQTALSPALARVHFALLQAANSKTRDTILVETLALALGRELVKAACGTTATAPLGVRPSSHAYYRDRCNFVKTYLAIHSSRAVSLAELATAAAVSPFHLARIFTTIEGIPIHRYLNRLRLHQALAPLRETNLPLTQVALEAGFSSHSHFTAAFRSEFGVTPARMRRAEYS